jgi:copper(I)-binding protein
VIARHRVLVLAAALACLAARAAGAVGVVTVSQPWVRPAALHADAPAYLTLGSSEGATLVGARSAAGDVVMMRGNARVAKIALTAGTPLAMAAAREHLVIRHVSRTLTSGQRVPLVLVLRDDAGVTREIEVNAEVRLRAPIDDERRAHGKH